MARVAILSRYGEDLRTARAEPQQLVVKRFRQQRSRRAAGGACLALRRIDLLARRARRTHGNGRCAGSSTL
jgi:hypothetical protein